MRTTADPITAEAPKHEALMDADDFRDYIQKALDAPNGFPKELDISLLPASGVSGDGKRGQDSFACRLDADRVQLAAAGGCGVGEKIFSAWRGRCG